MRHQEHDGAVASAGCSVLALSTEGEPMKRSAEGADEGADGGDAAFFDEADRL